MQTCRSQSEPCSKWQHAKVRQLVSVDKFLMSTEVTYQLTLSIVPFFFFYKDLKTRNYSKKGNIFKGTSSTSNVHFGR